MAEETQDGQKTLVAFVVGLLIGGMLVWAFSGPTASAPETLDNEDTEEQMDEDSEESSTDSETDTEEVVSEPAPTLQVGDGSVSVLDQPASKSIILDSVTYPISEGWIGVRSYNGDQLTNILGVARFSESQGLVPSEIPLLVSTTPGNTYAVVIYTEDESLNEAGRLYFNQEGDVQIAEIFDTFVAQ